MNRKELVRRAAEELREQNIRKPISVPKHVIHISDDNGHCKDFTFQKTEKTAMYTVDDVDAILGALLKEVELAICHGEEVSIFGYGSLGVHKRAARSTKIPGTDQFVDVAARMVPKFSFGTNLRAAARLYEMSLDDTIQQVNSCDGPETDEEIGGEGYAD